MILNNANSETLSTIIKENSTKYKDFINLGTITGISDGFSKKDSIISISLSESLLVDGVYPIRKKSDITLTYLDIVIDFELFDIFEDSGITVLKIYGSLESFGYFFGMSYDVGTNLQDYRLIITKLQVAQENQIKPILNVQTYNITETSFGIRVLDFKDDSERFRVRYRKAKSGDDWEFLEFSSSDFEINNLISDTMYEFKILRFVKYPLKYSEYSDSFFVKTF